MADTQTAASGIRNQFEKEDLTFAELFAIRR